MNATRTRVTCCIGFGALIRGVNAACTLVSALQGPVAFARDVSVTFMPDFVCKRIRVLARGVNATFLVCLLYTSDAADE